MTDLISQISKFKTVQKSTICLLFSLEFYILKICFWLVNEIIFVIDTIGRY